MEVGARFFGPIQFGCEVHTTPCAVGTGSFRGVICPRRIAYQQPCANTEAANGLKPFLCLPVFLHARVLQGLYVYECIGEMRNACKILVREPEG